MIVVLKQDVTRAQIDNVIARIEQMGCAVEVSQGEERTIIGKETQADEETAGRLVRLGEMVRNLRQHGLEEGASTRLLVYAAKMISEGIDPRIACEVAVTRAMSDDVEMQEAIAEIVSGIF